MTFRLPKEMDDVRASDQVRMLNIQEPNEGHMRKAELLCMLEFDTNFDSLEKWDIINKAFSPEDIFVIDGFKRTFKYGPDNIMNCKCAKCGLDQKVSFRFSILEFFPTDTDSTAVRLTYFSVLLLKLRVRPGTPNLWLVVGNGAQPSDRSKASWKTVSLPWVTTGLLATRGNDLGSLVPFIGASRVSFASLPWPTKGITKDAPTGLL
jgi:hypothetical protein